MTRAELKQQAKDTLRGRWGKAIGLFLVYELLIGAIGAVCNFIYGIGPIVLAIISVPLAFGYIGVFINYTRNEKADYLDFFSIGFDNFVKSWSIAGNIILKLIGYYLALFVCIFSFVGITIAGINAENVEMLVGGMIIAGIIYFVLLIIITVQSFYYVLANYIGNDNKELTGKEIVEKSKEIMKGHRMDYFVLQLSFLGWSILSVLSCGIGFIWLAPYMQVTYIKFYEDLINMNNGNENVIE